jgi:hypothetical protein
MLSLGNRYIGVVVKIHVDLKTDNLTITVPLDWYAPQHLIFCLYTLRENTLITLGLIQLWTTRFRTSSEMRDAVLFNLVENELK